MLRRRGIRLKALDPDDAGLQALLDSDFCVPPDLVEPPAPVELLPYSSGMPLREAFPVPVRSAEGLTPGRDPATAVVAREVLEVLEDTLALLDQALADARARDPEENAD